MKVNQSQNDYINHLSEQLQFLNNSCISFDNGFRGEAKRIATTIRVLLHDTPHSTSLLTLLDSKNIYYYSTVSEYNPRNMLAHLGLIGLKMSSTGSEYYPFLEDFPDDGRNKWVTFDKWWTGNVVLSDSKQNKFTRKDLILIGSNKDGGAHVDSKLDDIYAKLSRENSIGWTSVINGIEKPLSDPHLFSIRQMGHEILKTVNSQLPDIITF